VQAEELSLVRWILPKIIGWACTSSCNRSINGYTLPRRCRLGPSQRVDMITALKAMTIWPAWQHYEEASKGSIETGKLADFVILSEDPTAIDPEKIDQIKVVETIKEGETVFAATPEENRHAELMIRPGSEAESSFANMLTLASMSSDAAHTVTHKQSHAAGCLHNGILDALASGLDTKHAY
jgi:adenine deaminase